MTLNPPIIFVLYKILSTDHDIYIPVRQYFCEPESDPAQDARQVAEQIVNPTLFGGRGTFHPLWSLEPSREI